MDGPERHLTQFQTRKFVLDWVRRGLVLGSWAGGIGLLSQSGAPVIWLILWLPLGLFLMLNLYGFAMLPLYALFLHGPMRRALDAYDPSASDEEPPLSD